MWLASAAFWAMGAAGWALLWNSRRALPYTEAGRHFDPASGTVHDEQSVLVFGALAAAFAALALASLALGCRRSRA